MINLHTWWPHCSLRNHHHEHNRRLFYPKWWNRIFVKSDNYNPIMCPVKRLSFPRHVLTHALTVHLCVPLHLPAHYS